MIKKFTALLLITVVLFTTGFGFTGLIGFGAHKQVVADTCGVSNFSNVYGWYDPDLGITLNGSDVSQWDDQGSEGNDLVQTTASNQPLFVSSDSNFNNKSVVDFDGATEFMETAFATATTQPFFAAAVYNQGGANSTTNRLWESGDTSPPRLISADSTNLIELYAGSTISYAKTIPFTTPIVLTSLYNSTSSVLWENGTSKATGSIGTGVLSTAGIILASRSSGTGREMDGVIAAFRIFNEDPSNADHNVMGNCLDDRYLTGTSWTDI